MKVFFFSIFFIGIFVNAQFTYPDPKISSPEEDIEEKDELINLIIGKQKIKEFHKKSLGAENETNIEVKKFDIQGNVLFASDITEMPPGKPTRKDEFQTVSEGGKIISFEQSSLDFPTNKTEIFYDVKNNISKITEKRKEGEYIYEKGRLIRVIEKNTGEKTISTYEYTPTGKVTRISSEYISSKEKPSTSFHTFAYDMKGNILSNLLKDEESIIEKKYSYTDNLLTKYTLTFNGNKAKDQQYDYDENRRIKKMIKALYNPDKNTSTSTSSLVFNYNYKNGLLAERSTLFDGKEPAYVETFSYDDQKRIVRVNTQSENKVVANVNISYGNKTITLTGDTYQAEYTLYE
ncbi:hypothetical protein WH221_02350 [Chryseobacterium culicis]|uniref:YD repeat-containing protein n=1 Tax=Chryseobacterium culicis TaxID=680127 RepID=A0A2S9CX70_CHRCI|nr:hypothetical protein [Chryseobacterium culicis]PRB85117.1 hypothetical protein CQ022_02295 [Chryseobacterium culicis]PRB91159.1 hypothetical protein CQ033_10695 [Chryseobacterium culicis]